MKSIDPQVAEFLARLVGSPTPGVYTITLPSRYWRGETNDETLVALLDRIEERLINHEDRQHVDLRSMRSTELRQLMEKHFGAEWLSKDTEHNSPLEARHTWEKKAWRAHALAVSQWSAYWITFLVALVWLVHSIHTFFSRLYQEQANGLRRFAFPLLAQVIIGATGVAAAFVMPFTFWPGTLLVPVVAVVLLAEGWARARRRRDA